MLGVRRDFGSPFAKPRPVQVVDGGKVSPDDPLDLLVCCSLDLSCFVDKPNHTIMDVLRTD